MTVLVLVDQNIFHKIYFTGSSISFLDHNDRNTGTALGFPPEAKYIASKIYHMEALPRAVGTTAPHKAALAPNQAPVASSEIIISEPPARHLHSIPQAAAQPPVLSSPSILLRTPLPTEHAYCR